MWREHSAAKDVRIESSQIGQSPHQSVLRRRQFEAIVSSPAAAAKIGQISDRHNNYERKRRKKVPQPLENVVTLTCESAAEGGVCDVYVVGSDHKSPVSNVAYFSFIFL